MANAILGQILGGVLGRGRQQAPMGAGTGGLGDVLGGMMGRGGASPMGRGGSAFGGRSALMAMLLPLAMQWIQRNGGIGAVLQRFQQKGYAKQADSWVATGPNDAMPDGAVDDVVGMDELSRLSQQLGVEQDEVVSGMAEILPEVTDQLTPDGNLPEDADERLNGGISALEALLRQIKGG